MVFSSNIEKGTEKIAECDDLIQEVSIKRFNSKSSLLSKNVYLFNFEKEFLKYKPDIVITHLLHPHSFKALKLCQKLKIPCYLVTHAPFNVSRKFPLSLASNLYNQFKVYPNLNKFTRIIAITKWEMPYLIKAGAKKEKIQYIPNGLQKEFFIQKKLKSNREVLFLGRIAPVKNIETLLMVAKYLPNITFNLVGPAEERYLNKLKSLIKGENLANVHFLGPVYDLNKKIKIIDKHSIFVLPSLREGMPQSLIEAMARGKIVISSKTDGGKEIIQDTKNGFLFDINNSKQLAELIKQNINGNKKIEKQARIDAKKYSWEKLIKSYPFIK